MPTKPSGSDDVAELIKAMEAGDQYATSQLWELCFPKLLNYSRAKLPAHMRRVLDEEDVALSAFKSFCIRAKDGAFGEIDDRDALWRLLFCIAGRKAQQYVRHQTCQKRGGGKVGGESTFKGEVDHISGINQIEGHARGPVTLSDFAQDCQEMFDLLDDDKLRAIALLRVEGYSVDEIAAKMECAKRSVERRLRLIRTIWNSESRQET